MLGVGSLSIVSPYYTYPKYYVVINWSIRAAELLNLVGFSLLFYDSGKMKSLGSRVRSAVGSTMSTVSSASQFGASRRSGDAASMALSYASALLASAAALLEISDRTLRVQPDIEFELTARGGTGCIEWVSEDKKLAKVVGQKCEGDGELTKCEGDSELTCKTCCEGAASVARVRTIALWPQGVFSARETSFGSSWRLMGSFTLCP